MKEPHNTHTLLKSPVYIYLVDQKFKAIVNTMYLVLKQLLNGNFDRFLRGNLLDYIRWERFGFSIFIK